MKRTEEFKNEFILKYNEASRQTDEFGESVIFGEVDVFLKDKMENKIGNFELKIDIDNHYNIFINMKRIKWDSNFENIKQFDYVINLIIDEVYDFVEDAVDSKINEKMFIIETEEKILLEKKLNDFDLIDKIIEIADKEKSWNYNFDEEDYYLAMVSFNDKDYKIIKTVEDEEFLKEDEIKKIEYLLFEKEVSVFYKIVSKEVIYTKSCEKKIKYKK